MLRHFVLTLLLLCLACGPSLAAGMGSAAGTKQGAGQSTWSFGASEGRNDALWQQSVKAQDMRDRATPDSAANKKETTPEANSADAATQGHKHPKTGDLGVSWQKEKGAWHGTPNGQNTPDENVPVQSNHHVRAFADVDAGDDLSISVGPELIVKDKKNNPYSGNAEQPDSSVGMGMQFKLDF